MNDALDQSPKEYIEEMNDALEPKEVSLKNSTDVTTKKNDALNPTPKDKEQMEVSIKSSTGVTRDLLIGWTINNSSNQVKPIRHFFSVLFMCIFLAKIKYI